MTSLQNEQAGKDPGHSDDGKRNAAKGDDRKARLSQALRDNLRRRKVQMRARKISSEEDVARGHDPDKAG
ncbi:hypothetical protein [uncultured Cohaesibacter sp.]|uniref:hypothetical protein n=1 Tax=uncultured Cohaesibacter sp. TaxID=1002546 RepID=UPI0029312A2F|nr:hypothetical protein [uncultured Cohaesibacter sp.]